MNPARNPHHLLIFIIIALSLEAILFSVGSFKIDEELRKEDKHIEYINSTINNAEILAKSISIYDITSNKKIYGRNDDVPMPIASLAKIMTVVLGLQGHDLNETTLISEDAIKQAGDFGIFENEKWKLGDLARLTLIVSANDGGYALAESEDNFLKKANEKAKKIGMQNASFLNFTGLDIDLNRAGAYASAKDVNVMAWYGLLAEPEVFNITTLPEINLKSESGFVHNFKNTNPIIDKIPNLLLSKTGYTEIAGGNLTIIFQDKNNHKIAVTVLGSTFDGRFFDMEKIVNILYNN